MGRQELLINVVQPWKIKAGAAIAPVTIMVEGVHHGSHGPIYWASHILERFAPTWENVPVVVNHPMRDGTPISVKEASNQIIGRVTAPYYDKVGRAIKATLEIPITGMIDLSTLQNIREVSAGVFSDETYESGNWNGESYAACAISMEPDHLALLPDAQGACSWQDGCGIRANQSEAEIRQIFQNALEILIQRKGGGEQMNNEVNEILLPVAYEATREPELDLEAAQQQADESNILLPTEYNRSYTTKQARDNEDVLMPCGF